MIRLALRVRRERAEMVLAELLELAPAGVEEVGDGATVEYALYGPPGELPLLPALTAAAGDSLVEISTSEVPDDWSERWRRFHRPVLIEPPPGSTAAAAPVPALRVRPAWEPPASGADAGIEEIVIEPGQAFGTGAHATTRLCLELMLALAAADPRRGPLLDVGTGSGVLAICATRLGFAPVLALDNERESVAAAGANARVNTAPVEVRLFDLRTHPLPWFEPPEERSGELVLAANLLRPLLLELARSIPRAPAHVLAGGLLGGEVDEVVEVFARRLAMRERARRSEGEWGAVWLSPG